MDGKFLLFLWVIGALFLSGIPAGNASSGEAWQDVNNQGRKTDAKKIYQIYQRIRDMGHAEP